MQRIVLLLLVLSVLQAKATEIVVNDMVSMHNSARAEIGLGPVTWSSWLVSESGLSVAQCPTNHLPSDASIENLAWGWPTLSNNEAFKTWYDEKNYYTLATKTCQPDKVCGHYVNIIENSYVGCSIKQCNNLLGHPVVETYSCKYENTAPAADSKTTAPTTAPTTGPTTTPTSALTTSPISAAPSNAMSTTPGAANQSSLSPAASAVPSSLMQQPSGNMSLPASVAQQSLTVSPMARENPNTGLTSLTKNRYKNIATDGNFSSMRPDSIQIIQNHQSIHSGIVVGTPRSKRYHGYSDHRPPLPPNPDSLIYSSKIPSTGRFRSSATSEECQIP